MKYVYGMDIGGTKCATIISRLDKDEITFLARREFPTASTPEEVIDHMINDLKEEALSLNIAIGDVEAIGISSGGPLDSKKGLIQSPPNLKGWDNIPIVKIVNSAFNVPVHLLNDADASAIAEWKYGCGKGYKNLVFLTFGTGMGAGLILNGALYEGSNGMAGEVGHIRLKEDGPIGYNKAGSFEGFVSGGGLARQIPSFILEKKKQGYNRDWFNRQNLSAKDIALYAKAGDSIALEFYDMVGVNLGLGLSIIVDILNPEIIILGGIYMRSHGLMDQSMAETMKKEALKESLQNVRIMASSLGERIGDYATIAAALYNNDEEKK